MLKKSITYEDLDGNMVTEIFYFNYTMTELIKMENSVDGGLQKLLQNIVASDNRPEIVDRFEKIVLGAYGVRSEDGKRFVKSDELSEQFAQTPAYDTLFLELITSHNTMADFINAMMPKDFEKKVAQIAAAQKTIPTQAPVPPLPPTSQ